MPPLIRRLIVKLCDPNSSTSEHVQHPPSRSSYPYFQWTKVLSSVFSKREEIPVAEEPHCLSIPPLPEQPAFAPEVPQGHPTKSDHDCEQNLLVPINQLPVEVLAELFTSICHADSDKFLGDNKNRHRKTTPLMLGSVCRQWRAIVWSTPRIWSHVSLCLSTSRWQTQSGLLSDWLSRSGVCSLIINLCFDNEEEWASSIPEELVNTLAATAHRWSAINYVLPEDWYPLLEGIKDKLDILSTASTQPLWTDCSLPPSQRKHLTLFEHAPVLDCLHLNGYYLTDVSVQWDRLKRFTLQHVYLDECLYALPRTLNLTWCRIYTILVNDVNRTIVDPKQPIRLEHLETLIIYGAAWDDLLRLLSHLFLPALDTLIFTGLTEEILYPELYPVLLKVTGCTTDLINIRKLVVSELEWLEQPIGTLEKQLREFLALLPLLEDLEIDIASKTELSTAGFCVWWFIDLFKVPCMDVPHSTYEQNGVKVEDAISHQPPEPRSKLKGIDFEKSIELLEVLEEGSDSVTSPSNDIHPHLIPLPVSPLLSSSSLASRSSALDSHPDNPPILRNLQHFSFSGPVVLHHSLANTHTEQSDDETDSGRSEPPIQGLSCSVVPRPEPELGEALLQMLRSRREGPSRNHDKSCSDSSSLRSLAADSPWIPKQLRSFAFKASVLACREEKTRTPTDAVKAVLEDLSVSGGLKIKMGDVVWIEN